MKTEIEEKKNQEKFDEEVINITIKYIYNKSNSFPYKKERVIKVGDTIIYTDTMPIDSDVPVPYTHVDHFIEWCRKASFSIQKWGSL